MGFFPIWDFVEFGILSNLEFFPFEILSIRDLVQSRFCPIRNFVLLIFFHFQDFVFVILSANANFPYPAPDKTFFFTFTFSYITFCLP